MTAQPKPYITEEEYLVFERASAAKHEYYDGVISAMTGGKEPHNLIAGNTLAALHAQLRRKPCRVYQSDMRVKVLKTGLNTYPDLVVVCGQPQFTDASRDTVTNPIVLIEVLSPSTERYDRGLKFQHYQMIETLQEYVLIAADQQRVEHFTRRNDNEWLLQTAVGSTAVCVLPSIECRLSLADLYEKVEFEGDSQSLPHNTRL